MFFDVFILSLAVVVAVVAIIGCVVPALPGPVLAYGALWLAEWSSVVDFSNEFMLVMAGVTAVVFAADYFLPSLITRKFGGTKYAAWGSIIGMFIGMFIPVVGLILGLLVGAFVGELIFAKRSGVDSLIATIGAFLGFLVGSGLKLFLCFYILYEIIAELVRAFF